MGFKLHARVAISQTIDDTVTTIPVADATALPDIPFRAWIANGAYSNPAEDPEYEPVLIIAKDTGQNEVTVVRGQEGFSAQTHEIIGVTYYLTAGWTGLSAISATEDRGLNVKDCGALGDGVTNDRVAIQRAIDLVTGKGGGRVIFPPGLYKTGRIDVKANTHLVGSGRESTLIQSIADLDDCIVRFFENADNMSVTSMTVDGFRSGYGGSPSSVRAGCIRIVSNENVSVSDVDVVNSIDDAIYVKLADSINISVNRFRVYDAGRQGIAIVGGTSIRISDGIIDTTQAAGIDIEPAADSQYVNGIAISNLDVVKPGTYGIVGSLGGVTTPGEKFRDIRIVNVRVVDWGSVAIGDAIRITDYQDVSLSDIVAKIENASLYSASGHGVMIGSVYHATSGYTVRNLVVRNPSKAGLYLVGGSGKVFSRPIVSGCFLYGANKAATDPWANLHHSSFVEDAIIESIDLDTVESPGSLLSVGVSGLGDPQIRRSRGYGPVLTGAATLSIPGLREIFTLTGSIAVDNITATWKGDIIRILLDGATHTTKLNDATGNLTLSGDFDPVSSDMITLLCTGSGWREVSRGYT